MCPPATVLVPTASGMGESVETLRRSPSQEHLTKCTEAQQSCDKRPMTRRTTQGADWSSQEYQDGNAMEDAAEEGGARRNEYKNQTNDRSAKNSFDHTG